MRRMFSQKQIESLIQAKASEIANEKIQEAEEQANMIVLTELDAGLISITLPKGKFPLHIRVLDADNNDILLSGTPSQLTIADDGGDIEATIETYYFDSEDGDSYVEFEATGSISPLKIDKCSFCSFVGHEEL